MYFFFILYSYILQSIKNIQTKNRKINIFLNGHYIEEIPLADYLGFRDSVLDHSQFRGWLHLYLVQIFYRMEQATFLFVHFNLTNERLVKN